MNLLDEQTKARFRSAVANLRRTGKGKGKDAEQVGSGDDREGAPRETLLAMLPKSDFEVQLDAKDDVIAEKDTAIAEKDKAIAEKDAELDQMRAQLAKFEGETPKPSQAFENS